MTRQNHLTSQETNPAAISIPRLRATLNGRVTTPSDAAYDEARAVFYGGIDRRPAVIVQVANAADVARVVSLAYRPANERSEGHEMKDLTRRTR